MKPNKTSDATFELDENGNLKSKGNAQFEGKVKATSGEFTGKITSTEGSIGGFKIANNYIGEDGNPDSDSNFTAIYNDGRALFCHKEKGEDEKVAAFRVYGETEFIGDSIALSGDIHLNATGDSPSPKINLQGQLNMSGTFSGTESGDVYKDAFGSLFVRAFTGTSNIKQINCVFGVSSCQLPALASAYKGTIYIVKLTGDGRVYSTAPIMNSHDRGLWSYSGGYYSENLYQESHFLVFDGTNWIDYHCSAQ